MSLAEINTEMTAAVAALKAADYDTALTRALCAQGLIAASPDVKHGDEEISWSFERVESFVQKIRRAQAADTAAGGNVKDITSKAITQLAGASPSQSDKQALINVRADELDMANGFRWVKLVITLADTTSPVGTNDAMGFLLGLGPRYGPAYDNDLASVAEIIN